MDSTGNPLDQAAVSHFIDSVLAFFGPGLSLSESDLFDLLVVCTIVPIGGGKFIFGGASPDRLSFEDQISPVSYQCCIDYNGDNCSLQQG